MNKFTILATSCLLSLLLLNCKSKPKEISYRPSTNDFIEIPTHSISQNNLDTIYTVVEQMPSFPGGEADLMKYLVQNITYPKIPDSEEYLLATRITARFYIDADGSVRDVRIQRSMHPAVDSIFVRVLKNMPKWEPGKQNGKNVPVYYTIPLLISPARR